ncbi:translation initiation factor IF-3 [candidate division LCP-89 bacterium B3_LCP]|uniref:Translation initiation factor IF-3 n=1 Tax=candidate division LCP-89 bacterium B3_LCP TaxID=2012998 RepID=A0A532V5G7_UNCL8|nr:MAG: translation initiation factor IF-3 [candidate division LCP-89 bacterium B3_LCP]
MTPASRRKRVFINDQIRVTPVRLIDADGGQAGIVDIGEARRIADSSELDLVLIAPQAKPPVCRVMDFGKYRYEIAKREKSSKKQPAGQIKGIRLSPKISDHDFNFKAEAARKFLVQGNKVKVTVLFRGRLITHKEFGVKIIEKFVETLEDIAKLESAPKMEGHRNMVVILVKK